jgi:hypothetical protein
MKITKTSGEELIYALEHLEKANENIDDFKFNFCIFTNSFKRTLEKAGILKHGEKKET